MSKPKACNTITNALYPTSAVLAVTLTVHKYCTCVVNVSLSSYCTYISTWSSELMSVLLSIMMLKYGLAPTAASCNRNTTSLSANRQDQKYLEWLYLWSSLFVSFCLCFVCLLGFLLFG